jgi:hypothetical protein
MDEKDWWDGDGWLSRKGWVAKSVARQLATAVLWVRSQTSLKNQNGRHKRRSGRHTPARQKKKKKKKKKKKLNKEC